MSASAAPPSNSRRWPATTSWWRRRRRKPAIRCRIRSAHKWRAELARHFDEKQRMDVVFTVGQYTQVSMFLNTFGVQLDAGQTLDPDLKGF